MEALFVFFVFVIVMLIVAAVGHLLWLLFAAIGRLFFGGDGVEPKNRKPPSPSQQISQDLQAADRLVSYASFKGWLNDVQIESLNQLLAAFRERQHAEHPPVNESTITTPPPAWHQPSSASVAPTPTPTPTPTAVMPILTEPSRPANTVIQAFEVHPLDQPEVGEPARQLGTPSSDSSEKEPAKPLGADLLRTFMERSNIRWIEIISATLIVVCSVGLVISLWNTLSATSRYFPSVVFLLAAIAVHGAGQYTLRQWKLRSTSRGILHIGLMLIPLAVLVGILLSRRPDQSPQLDFLTTVVLTIGTIVYGVLAVTASRALFAGRWLPVASAVILGSLTLVPIHFLASRGQLASLSSGLALAPLVLISLWNVLQLSIFASLPVSSAGRLRRVSSQVLQVVFAAIVPCAFWIMHSKGISLSKSSVAAGGIMLAGWASWGWTASLKRLVASYEAGNTATTRAIVSSGSSWYIVVAWCLAGVCSLGLAAIVWQALDDRTMLIGTLLGLAIWWYFHGLHCGLLTSLFVATMSLILSISLLAEGQLPTAQPQLAMSDWLTLSRVSCLSIVSLIVGFTGWAMTKLSWSSQDFRNVLTPLGGPRASLPKLAMAILAGVAAMLLGTAGLTTLASLVPFSQPAYGGNWAPLMLLAYGGLLLAVGITQTKNTASLVTINSTVQRLNQTLVPLGQLVLLLAAFKLCHSAPWAPEWLVELRPYRAWAIGAAGLALIWSGMAAVLRWLSTRQAIGSLTGVDSAAGNQRWKHQYSASWLSAVAVGLVTVAAPAFWLRDDKFLLASSAGWVLPLVLSLGFYVLRQSMLRESVLLAISGWALTLATSVGWHYDWWGQLGLSATVSVLVIVQLLLLAIYAFLTASMSVHNNESQLGQWPRSGHRWADDLLLNLSWAGTLLTAIIPLAMGLYFNLFGSQLTDKFFVSAPLTASRAVLVLIALIGLGLLTFHWRSSRASVQRHWLATLPIAVAALVSCQMISPYGVPTLLWLVAVSLLVLELLPLTGTIWGKQVAQLNQLSADGKQTYGLSFSWLHSIRWLNLGSLFALTISVFWVFAWQGALPQPLAPLAGNTNSWSGWMSNIARILIWIGPLTLVLAGRWLYSLYTAAPSVWIIQRGYSLGVLVAIVCTLAGALNFSSLALFGAQSLSLTMLLLSAKTLGLTTLRNWLGLRHLDRQSNAVQILRKACRGARWREARRSSTGLWLGSIIPTVLLCAIAGGLVAFYPHRVLPELRSLGGWWTFATVALSLGMWWVLRTDESLPKFGLLAITLGLLSPIISVGYASWLIDQPGFALASTGNFEPYRLQVGLWLVSLLVGLAIRVYSTVNSTGMSWPVEASWILLAVLVGMFSILGMSDANWSSAQLAVLAIVIAISCEASGQTWRGYVAATVSLLAWAPWCMSGLRAAGILFAWQSLLAVVIVGLVLVLVRYAFVKIQVVVRQQSSWTLDRVIVLAVPLVSASLSGLWMLFDAPATRPTWALWSVLAMVALTFGLAVARLFQPQSGHRGLGVYLTTIAMTLVTIQVLCSQLFLARVYSHLAWWSGLLASMAALAVVLREVDLQRTPFQAFLRSKNLADPVRLSGAKAWMALWHTLVALFCLIPSVGLVLTMSQEGLRMAAIALPLLGAAAIIPLSYENLRSFQRSSVLLLASATLVLAWWADLPSAWALREQNQSWLFAQRAFLALVVLSLLYPVVAYFRREGDQWIGTLSGGAWVCVGAAGAIGSSMVFVTATGHWSDYAATVPLVVKLLTCMGWACLFARLIQFAAWPQGWDRSAGSTLRTTAVYAAELSIALGSAATYFHFPDLFRHGHFVNWWPVILFGIALMSTLLGEWLKRIELPVLADPIRRSSLLLPIIPIAGVWAIQPERATMLWNDFERFAVLLVIASSLYGLHGWVRGSVALRGFSAGLALLGFWSFLHSHPDMRFFEHPQFWLLPPAIGSLLFVEWNRARLDATVVTSVRYLSILVAYFSSSSEVFFRSFAGNLWPPIFLLFLALCGVFAGLVLRVRAFLFCGMIFVLIALIGMVWHAAQAIDQVWPWWAFGIATGVCLIVMLGYFEKNRPRILFYLESLKQWDV